MNKAHLAYLSLVTLCACSESDPSPPTGPALGQSAAQEPIGAATQPVDPAGPVQQPAAVVVSPAPATDEPAIPAQPPAVPPPAMEQPPAAPPAMEQPPPVVPPEDPPPAEPSTWGEKFCPAGPFNEAPLPDNLDVVEIANNGKNIEGPIWLAEQETLLYCSRGGKSDRNGYDVMQWTQQGGAEFFMEGPHCCGFSFFPGGDLLVAQGRLPGNYQVGRLNLETKEITKFADVPDGEGPNDIATTVSGATFTQSFSNALERVDKDGNVERIGRSNANGITLSPDERTLYITDGQIRSYDLDEQGNIVDGPKNFGPGGTGGMAVDCAGNVYAANGGEVVVHAPNGDKIGAIGRLTRPSNVAFGGPDQKTLFITGFEGHVWTVQLGIPGLPY